MAANRCVINPARWERDTGKYLTQTDDKYWRNVFTLCLYDAQVVDVREALIKSCSKLATLLVEDGQSTCMVQRLVTWLLEHLAQVCLNWHMCQTARMGNIAIYEIPCCQYGNCCSCTCREFVWHYPERNNCQVCGRPVQESETIDPSSPIQTSGV